MHDNLFLGKDILANDEISGIGEVGDELEVSNRTIPDETLITDKEEPPCCIRLNEEAGKDYRYKLYMHFILYQSNLAKHSTFL